MLWLNGTIPVDSVSVWRESAQEIPAAELIMKIVDLFESNTVWFLLVLLFILLLLLFILLFMILLLILIQLLVVVVVLVVVEEQEDVKLVLSVNFGGEQADATKVVVMIEVELLLLFDDVLLNEGDNFRMSPWIWDADDFDEYAVIVEDVSSSASLKLSESPNGSSSSFSGHSLIVFNTRASYKTDVDVVWFWFIFSQFSLRFLLIVTLVVLVDAITEDALVINFNKKWKMI